MVIITELAAKEVQNIITQQHEAAKKDGQEPAPLFLRVGVKGGGCSGFSYSLDLTETAGENDEQWENHGVKVICDSKSHLYLEGVTIDFKDEVKGRGFVFNNPNASSTCGCGSSFSA